MEELQTAPATGVAIGYRRATDDDRAFIEDSWIESYKTSHAAGLIAIEDWYAVMIGQIRRVLARPECSTIVAYHPGETDPRRGLFGWVCVEKDFEIPQRTRQRVDGRLKWVEYMVASDWPLVHYCYVKLAYRRMGIARGLFRAAAVDPKKEFFYTCKTGIITKLQASIPWSKWNPMIARQAKTPRLPR